MVLWIQILLILLEKKKAVKYRQILIEHQGLVIRVCMGMQWLNIVKPLHTYANTPPPHTHTCKKVVLVYCITINSQFFISLLHI